MQSILCVDIKSLTLEPSGSVVLGIDGALIEDSWHQVLLRYVRYGLGNPRDFMGVYGTPPEVDTCMVSGFSQVRLKLKKEASII